MMDRFKYLDKEVWHRIINREMIKDGEKFDELKILSVQMVKRGNKLELHLNYRTDSGSSTSFGKIEVDAEDLPAIFREDKINQII